MKKFLFALLATFAIAGGVIAANYSTENTANCECHYGQCSAIKADGYQCKNCAQQGSYYCWSHNHQ